MIRAATLSDLPRLFALVEEMHEGSYYAAQHVDIDDATVKSILRDGAMRSGRDHLGATLLNVVEKNGVVEGFLLGILQRVYTIGNRLEAQDYLFYCSPRAPATGASRLIDAYLEWGLANPRVHEVKVSWTDVMGVDGAKLGKLYQRKGFERCGEIYKRAA